MAVSVHENFWLSVLGTQLMTDVDYLFTFPCRRSSWHPPLTKLPHCCCYSGNTQIVTNVSSDILTQLWDFWSRPTNLWWQQWDLLLAVIHKKLSMPIDKRWDLWSPHCGFVLTTVHTSSGGDIGRHQPVTITITTLSSHLPTNVSAELFTFSRPLLIYVLYCNFQNEDKLYS